MQKTVLRIVPKYFVGALLLTLAWSSAAQIGVRLYGKVTDDAGKPVQGAAVEITVWEEGSKQTVSAETDKKGRYRAVMMHNSKSYRFVVTKEGFQTVDEVEEPGLKRTNFNAPVKKDFQLTPGSDSAAGAGEGIAGMEGSGDGPAAYNLGVKALEEEDFENARLAFEKAVASDPEFALGHVALATVLCELEEFDGAIEAAKKAVELEGDVRSFEILHRAASEVENREALGQALEGLAEKRPDKKTARMLYNDGVDAYDAEAYDRAAKRFLAAKEIEPSLREAGRALSRTYLKQGKFEEAQAEAELLVEQDQYDLEALDVLQRAREALRGAGD